MYHYRAQLGCEIGFSARGKLLDTSKSKFSEKDHHMKCLSLCCVAWVSQAGDRWALFTV